MKDLELLNQALVRQLNRIEDPTLKNEELTLEIERSRAVTNIAKQLINSGKVIIESRRDELRVVNLTSAAINKSKHARNEEAGRGTFMRGKLENKE
jgi:hypothetical protein